jgi:hypothetical protein
MQRQLWRLTMYDNIAIEICPKDCFLASCKLIKRLYRMQATHDTS